uniref:SIT4 phosphatase-associated protein family, armadillo-type fold protein n=1 Tax=Tanacetum cinerariifolium TaxID=118510 RepID=A0A6L2N598_TANCI|nr:SIT4 phosphatase-associated protein family, armadillo-type fold protein [Tanacetum cinerariifolium]
MVKLSFDLNVRKESSDTDEAAQYSKNIVHFRVYLNFALAFYRRCFTPTTSRSYVSGQVDVDNETEEKSDTEENDTSGSDSEDLYYDLKHDEVFHDDEHILEDVLVSMNNFNFNPDHKHDLSIVAVEVQEHDLDVIDFDSFGSDFGDGIDSEMRIQLRELRRIGKEKNQGPNKYYFYLGQQFANKKIVNGIVKKHSAETRRKLILPASFVEGPIVEETDDPFDGLDEILGDYANNVEEITRGGDH